MTPDQADAESLYRLPPCDRLGQSLGQFIEFVVHNFPFVLFFAFDFFTKDFTDDSDDLCVSPPASVLPSSVRYAFTLVGSNAPRAPGLTGARAGQSGS